MICRWMMLGLLCLPATGLVGCSSGSDGPPPLGEFDATGWWEMKIRQTGSGKPFVRATLVQMLQNSNLLMFEGVTVTINGNKVHEADPSETHPDRIVSDWIIVNSDLIEGTTKSYEGGELEFSIDDRLERVGPPTGTLVANGLVDGEMVNVNVPTGFAVHQFSEQFEYSDLTLCVSLPDSSLDLYIEIDDIAPIPTGSYDISPWPGEGFIFLSVSTDSSWEDAVSGTLDFEEFSRGRVAGGGTATLESGAVLHFAFDVDIVATFDMANIISS